MAASQPVPFDHKQHAGLGLTCNQCHTLPDPGEIVTIPKVAQCNACHDSRYKQEIPWVREVQLPSWVYFSHKVHIQSGATCETCHAHETNISMGGCVSCHREKKATQDCAACHEAKS